MNWSVLRLLYVHELKMLVRARRTVVMAIVLPALIMPLMRRHRLLTGTTYRYAVTGALADRVRDLIDQGRQRIAQGDDADLDRLREFKFVETPVTNARESLDKNDIQFYVDGISGEEADKFLDRVESVGAKGSAASRAATARRLKGIPSTNVVYRGDRDGSDNAHDQMMALLRLARRQDSQARLVEHGF